MYNNEEERAKEYKNKVLFLRKSKKGEHLYAFQRDGILGKEIESLILNVSEVKALIQGKLDLIKVSAIKKQERDAGDASQEELDGGDSLKAE